LYLSSIYYSLSLVRLLFLFLFILLFLYTAFNGIILELIECVVVGFVSVFHCFTCCKYLSVGAYNSFAISVFFNANLLVSD